VQWCEANIWGIIVKYDKWDQQGKAAFNERNPQNVRESVNVSCLAVGHTKNA
jgi:hypothetical protein